MQIVLCTFLSSAVSIVVKGAGSGRGLLSSLLPADCQIKELALFFFVYFLFVFLQNITQLLFNMFDSYPALQNITTLDRLGFK